MTAPSTPETVVVMQRLASSLIRLQAADRRFHGVASKSLALTETDLTALLLVGDSPTTPGSLERQLSLSTGAITALVDRLEDSGHIGRANDPADRRRVRLFLTEGGEKVHREVRAAYLARLTDSVAPASAPGIVEQIDRFSWALDAVESI